VTSPGKEYNVGSRPADPAFVALLDLRISYTGTFSRCPGCSGHGAGLSEHDAICNLDEVPISSSIEAFSASSRGYRLRGVVA